MTIPKPIFNALDNWEDVVAPLSATLEDHISWVTVFKLFRTHDPGKPVFGASIHPNAKYIIRWAEMKRQKYDYYLTGSDINSSEDSAKFEQEFADSDEQLEILLLKRGVTLDKLIEKSKSNIKYPK